jgi:hypothetical protein
VKTRTTPILFVSGLLSAAFIASPAFVRAQAPPGPMRPAQPQPPAQGSAPAPQPLKPAPQPRQTIAGAWKLNLDDSDDARKKMEQSRGSGGGSGGNGPYGGSRRSGGGYPYPGGGGGRGPYGGRSGPSDDDRQRMRDLFHPADSFTIALKEAEVDLTDDQDRRRVFFTDGRKPQKSKDDRYQEFAAHWEGTRLVSEEKAPSGGKVTRTYELALDGLQLRETVRIENGRSDVPLILRYVYDVAPENKQLGSG